MNIDVITLLPEIFDALKWGVTSKALLNQSITLNTWNPRHYTSNTHNTVDDRPYGGGPGMVMLYEPLAKTIIDIHSKREQTHTVYLTPQGKPLTQTDVVRLSKLPQLTLLCGRYEGIDQRLIDDYVDEEISLGDFILSGGEIPAMSMIDAVARLMPEVLGCSHSAEQDSFSNGLLEGPCYTRPEVVNGRTVPSVLTSGNHRAISDWRRKESVRITWQRRPDLIKRHILSPDEWDELHKLTEDRAAQQNKGNDNE